MMFTIPVKRKYKHTEDTTLSEIAAAIEKVYKSVRINGVNVNRFRAYFGACEVCTMWYVVKRAEKHADYGFETEYKLKCRTYSPMDKKYSKVGQAKLYPLFDEYDDLIAISIEYTRKEEGKDVNYFDCYMNNAVYMWRDKGEGYVLSKGEDGEVKADAVAIGKIQGVYWSSPTAVYEGLDNNRNEIEFAMSRQSDIIRKNSAPMIRLVGEMVNQDDKPATDVAREVFHMEQGGDVSVVTPTISKDNVDFFIGELKKNIEEYSQMPNLSMENTKGLGALSGEARKTLLTDAHMRVGEESHDIIWGLERECSVIKAFLGVMNPAWAKRMGEVEVEHIITPFVQNDRTVDSKRLIDEVAGGVKSRETAVKELGSVDDVEAEVARINDAEASAVGAGLFEPTE